jgi:hypothetical protein
MELNIRRRKESSSFSSDISSASDFLNNIPDEVLKKIVFSVPWQYASESSGGRDPDGFDAKGPYEKNFNELKREELQTQCFNKFHTNPQINSAIRDMTGRMTGEGFGTSSGVQEIQEAIEEIELDWRNRLYYFWPKYVARFLIEGELYLCLTVHEDGFVEVDFIDPANITGCESGTGIIWHPTKTLLPLFYNIQLKGQIDSFLLPSIFVARSPKLVDIARKDSHFSEEKASRGQRKPPGARFSKIGGYQRFIVSCDKGYMTRRAISYLVTTIEWLNHYENLKKYEIDYKKSSGSYAWVFYFEDLAGFRNWMALSDDEKRKTGVGAKMVPGARLMLPPGMKVEVKNPQLTTIREQDTDIMSMAISGLNIPEDVATGQSRGTFASVKASRGPMSDRVSDENAYFGRWMKYDFWGSVFFLKNKMGVLEERFKVRQAIGFKNKKPIFKNVSKLPEQLVDISYPMSEISDVESRVKAYCGVKHGPVTESVGIPNSEVARRIGVEGYARARLKKATEDELYPELVYELGMDTEKQQENTEGERGNPKNKQSSGDDDSEGIKDRRKTPPQKDK